MKCDADQKIALSLLNTIRGRKSVQKISLFEITAWVSEHLLDALSSLDPAEIPNGEALSLLLWAKRNPNRFRQMYDSKRMPTRGALEEVDKRRRPRSDRTLKLIDNLLQVDTNGTLSS